MWIVNNDACKSCIVPKNIKQYKYISRRHIIVKQSFSLIHNHIHGPAKKTNKPTKSTYEWNYDQFQHKPKIKSNENTDLFSKKEKQ